MPERNMVLAVLGTHTLKNRIYRHFQTIQWMNDERLSGLFFRITFGTLILLFLQACTPALYHVDLKYQPTEKFIRMHNTRPDYLITVAEFNDVRKTDDRLKMGKVTIDHFSEVTVLGKNTTEKGRTIPVYSNYPNVSDAVTMNVRDYLFKSGYWLSDDIPRWNLRKKTIKKAWGKILIGGNINELTVNCDGEFPMLKCRSRVNLTLTIADIPKKKVIYKSSVEGSASREELYFSEGVLEAQINAVFSDALDRMFNDPEVKKQIDHAVK